MDATKDRKNKKGHGTWAVARRWYSRKIFAATPSYFYMVCEYVKLCVHVTSDHLIFIELGYWMSTFKRGI